MSKSKVREPRPANEEFKDGATSRERRNLLTDIVNRASDLAKDCENWKIGRAEITNKKVKVAITWLRKGEK
jgi:hypothetical protein